MKLRRYCVTVMDNWTALRVFWTLEGAKRFYKEHRSCAYLYKWERGAWRQMLAPFNPAQAPSPVSRAQGEAPPTTGGAAR